MRNDVMSLINEMIELVLSFKSDFHSNRNDIDSWSNFDLLRLQRISEIAEKLIELRE